MSNVNTLGSFGDTSNSSLMFRNKVINGNFDIWQRGTSQTATGYGSDDRWSNDNTGSTKTASRQTFTLGQTDVSGSPRYFSRTVVASVAGAGNFAYKYQKVEGVSTLAGQSATFSFWAKADASKNIAVEFVQGFGTGGSPSTTVTGIGTTTVALTASWQKFTVVVAVPTISGKTLGTDNNDFLSCNFWFDAGSTSNSRTNSLGQQSGTFDIAQVQLETGSQATPFEQRPIGMELSLCQRYYEFGKSSFATVTTTGTSYGIPIVFKIQKRAIPIVSTTQITSNIGNTGQADILINEYSYSYFLTSNATGTGQLQISYTANSEL